MSEEEVFRETPRRRRWRVFCWVMVLIAAVVGVVGLAAVSLLRTPPQHRARCVLSVGNTEALKTLDPGRSYGPAPTASDLVPFARDSMLEHDRAIEVIQAAGLDRGIPEGDVVALEELYMGLKGGLQVSAIGQELIEVSYAHPDPDTSQFVVRELVSNLLERTLTHERNQARRAVNSILEEKDEAEAQLGEAEMRLKQFREQNADRMENLEPGELDQLWNLERECEMRLTQYQERVEQFAEAQHTYELSLTAGTSMFNTVVPARVSAEPERPFPLGR